MCAQQIRNKLIKMEIEKSTPLAIEKKNCEHSRMKLVVQRQNLHDKLHRVIKGFKVKHKIMGKLYLPQEYVIHEIINLSQIDVEIQCILDQNIRLLFHI